MKTRIVQAAVSAAVFIGCGDSYKETGQAVPPSTDPTDTGATEDTDTDTNTDTDTDTTDPALRTGDVGVVEVPPVGPYGTHAFRVEARANWVNTGLFLRKG